jgi:cyclase
MLKTRVIPSLLLHNGGLYKTVKFKDPRYVGDPINAIKIFNDKEVDELVVLDIDATRRKSIDFALLNRLNKEAFMPFGYGGGIQSVDDIKRILNLGYEKVIINHHALTHPEFITAAARACGSQSVVVCLDVKRDRGGRHRIFDHIARKTLKFDAVEYARTVSEFGAGEIIAYSVDRDGTYSGYDLEILKAVSNAVPVPVVALGGARHLQDFVAAVSEGHASAVAAGSMFVFHGPHRAVLITYPDKADLKNCLL